MYFLVYFWLQLHFINVALLAVILESQIVLFVRQQIESFNVSGAQANALSVDYAKSHRPLFVHLQELIQWVYWSPFDNF